MQPNQNLGKKRDQWDAPRSRSSACFRNGRRMKWCTSSSPMSWLGYWGYDWTKPLHLKPETPNRRFRTVSDRLRMLEPRLLPYFLSKWKYSLAPQRARDTSRRFGLCTGPLLPLFCIAGPFSTILEGRVKRTPEFTTLSSLCEKLSQGHLFYTKETP